MNQAEFEQATRDLPALVIAPPRASPRGARVPRGSNLDPRLSPYLNRMANEAALRTSALLEFNLEALRAWYHGRRMKDEQLYARWCARRVLRWAESMRRGTYDAVASRYGNLHFRYRGGEALQPGAVISDSRLMVELPTVLRQYGCPQAHCESIARLVRNKLRLEWKV